MTGTDAWPLNGNAWGLMASIVFMLFSDAHGQMLGLGLCMMFCTIQICQTIRDHHFVTGERT